MIRLMLACVVFFYSVLSHAEPIKIGLLLDDLRVERWQKDRDYFVAQAQESGAKVYVKSANGDAATQAQQIENMVQRGVNVLVIIPSDASSLTAAIAKAKQAGIKVLAYDRLITNAAIDLYLSFDNIKVGEMQAQALVALKPKGNYFLIGGAPSDNNAKMFRAGQMKILQPLVDAGDIHLVGDGWAEGWSADEAKTIMAAGIAKNAKNIDVVVASNDGTAGGAIQSLEAAGLAGKVLVSGQDADLAGLRRIVQGSQVMTVYKPIRMLAQEAAALALKLAADQAITTTNKIDNGAGQIPAIYLEPILVTKSNIDSTVVADGYHGKNDIY